jgi:endonuclease III
MEPSGTLARIAAVLRKAYGPRQPQRRWENPLDSLIHTVLSQNTTASNCERAYTTLRRRFRTWEDVWGAPLKDVVAGIRAGGLANIKAVRIKALLEEIWKEQGHFDLSFLRDVPDDDVRAYLGRFKGIGDKTTACVLLFGLGRAAFPVDTHVFRVCRRLGLLDGQPTPEKAQAFLEPLVRPRDRHALHVQLVEHGRRVCKARRPECSACVLAPACPYGRRSRGNGKG